VPALNEADFRVVGEADASSKRFTRRIIVNGGGKVLGEIHGTGGIILSERLRLGRRLLRLGIDIQKRSFKDAFPRGLE
jgi:hypothetical protein